MVPADIKGPHIDWAAVSPLVALTAGIVVTLMLGLFPARAIRARLVPLLTLITFGAAAGLGIWQWDTNEAVIAGAMRIDGLTNTLLMLFAFAGAAATLLSLRGGAPEEAGHGEFYSLLLSAVLGMVVLAGAENLVTVFVGYELLSIPLYVLCATDMRRATSLESGLKYLIIGSVGSATLLYGLALIYGATGSTSFRTIAGAIDGDVLGDPLLLAGIALALVGLAFKSSVAPFHQWTPDVYEGAPSPITGFMAVATKAAAFGVILRIFDVALISEATDWAPILAVLAVVTIAIGNVGAIGQSSLKRLLAYSSVAQAGYLLAGVVVSTRLGIEATVFYLVVYLFMNLAAFAVIVARERETDRGDDMSAMHGLGRSQPWLAWPMTIAMLSLAGFPATAGFFGKIELIRAAVDNDYAFVGVAIVVGSAISLVYYLRVVAAVWMSPGTALVAGRPAMSGGSQEADAERRRFGQSEVAAVAVLCAAATIFFGIVPGPLFDFARHAATSFTGLLG